MRLPALVFPCTAPRRSLFSLLWPLFEPVVVLEPAGLGAAGASPLAAAGLMEYRRPPADPLAAQDGQDCQMGRLLAQWEAWAVQHKGSVLSEALKAGINLPDPGHEAYRELRRGIKSGRPEASPLLAATPQFDGDLFLRLMQLKDLETAQMEELQTKVESGQDRLAQIIGLEEEDALPADYDEPFWQKLPPLDYDPSVDPHLERRLGAWAGLAHRTRTGPACLATADLKAVQRLITAANRRLLLSPSAQGFTSAPGGDPNPNSPLAQEAARLLLPSLEHLSDELLLEVKQGLKQERALPQIRQGLHNLLTRLAQEHWSPGLGRELAQSARMLAESLAGHLTALGLELGAPTRGLSILALPGLSQEKVLELMAGQGDEGLPTLADWPQGWPAGSCPLIAAW
ncbi:conserved hypothetical protein [Desulfarculales bacterium]